MIQFDEHIFQLGWNHQLLVDIYPPPKKNIDWTSHKIHTMRVSFS